MAPLSLRPFWLTFLAISAAAVFPPVTSALDPHPAPRETVTIAQAATASRAPASDPSIRPFRAHFPDEALTDMKRRIAATRWPDKETVADDSQGVELSTMQALANLCPISHLPALVRTTHKGAEIFSSSGERSAIEVALLAS